MPKRNGPKPKDLAKRQNTTLFDDSRLPIRSKTELTQIVRDVQQIPHKFTQSEELLQIGKALLAQGHLKEAALIFGLTKIDEHRAEAILETAKKLAEMGNKESARKLLYNVLKFKKGMQYFEQLNYKNLVGIELAKLGFKDEARIIFNELLKEITSDPENQFVAHIQFVLRDVIKNMLDLGFIPEVLEVFNSKESVTQMFSELADAIVKHYSTNSILAIIPKMRNRYYKATLYFKVAEKIFDSDRNQAIDFYQKAMSEINLIEDKSYNYDHENLKESIINKLLVRNLPDGALLLIKLLKDGDKYKSICKVAQYFSERKELSKVKELFEKAIEDVKKSHDAELKLTTEIVPQLMDLKLYDLAMTVFNSIKYLGLKIECLQKIINGYLQIGNTVKAFELYATQKELINQMPKDGNMYNYHDTLTPFIEYGQLEYALRELKTNPNLQNKHTHSIVIGSSFYSALHKGDLILAKKLLNLMTDPKWINNAKQLLESALRQQKVLKLTQRKQLK